MIFSDWFECRAGRTPKHVLKTLVKKADIATLFSLRLLSESLDEEYFQEFLSYYRRQLKDDDIEVGAPLQKWRKSEWPAKKHTTPKMFETPV